MPTTFHDDESAFCIMVAAMKDLEAQATPLTEPCLFETVRERGVSRAEVRAFMEKVRRGQDEQQRRRRP